MNNKIILIIVVLVGLILRVVNISADVLPLYGDELTIGLDSYSILTTGQDQLGNRFPLTFSMGAGRPAGYVYGSLPFIAIFGPTALGIRGLSILSGLGIIMLLYYIGRKLFSEKVGLLAAGVTTLSIWDISLSRGGYEAHFALFLVLLATYFFISAKQKPFFYIFSAISFGLVLHTYPTYKVILPLFLLLLIWYEGGIKKYFEASVRNHFFTAAVILAIFTIFAATQTFIGGSEERFSNINVFSQRQLKEEIEQKVNFERSITDLPQFIAKYFHNKPMEYLKVIGENYLQNFSTDFLFIHGDRNPRHNMATMGEIYFAEIILILLAIVFLWQKEKKILALLMGWILIGALGSTALGPPHALRSAFMLPPLILLSANGLNYLFSLPKNIFITNVKVFLAGIFIIQFVFFAQKLYFLAPNEYSRFWSYPAKLASDITRTEKDKFDYVLLSDGIDNVEFAYPVYAKIEPSLVILQNQQRKELAGYQFKKFDNVYIGYLPDGEIENFILNLSGSVLYIGQLQKRDILIDHDIIKGRDNMPALLIIRKI